MDAFSEAELATLDHVLLKYGGDSGLALSKMTHEEALPWSSCVGPRSSRLPCNPLRHVSLAGQHDGRARCRYGEGPSPRKRGGNLEITPGSACCGARCLGA